MTGWEAEGSNSPRGGCYGQAEPLRTLQASLGGGGVQRRPVTPSTGFIHSGGGVLSPIPCTRATPGCQGKGGEGRPTAEEDTPRCAGRGVARPPRSGHESHGQGGGGGGGGVIDVDTGGEWNTARTEAVR